MLLSKHVCLAGGGKGKKKFNLHPEGDLRGFFESGIEKMEEREQCKE